MQQYQYHKYVIRYSTLEDDYVINHYSHPGFLTKIQLTETELEEKAYARFAHTQQAALMKNPDRPHREIVNKMKLSRMNAVYEGLSPWCLTWFSHYTFRDGRSDADLYASFREYVYTYEWMQDIYHVPQKDFEKVYGEPYVCLMGAQDYWRHTDICTCEDCVKFDIVRIGH